MPHEKIKLTMAFDTAVHRAMTTLARDCRRSFTSEVQIACDEHLARAGMTKQKDQTDTPNV